MGNISASLTHNGVEYAATIVTIERTELGREDHGIWHTMLHVAWGSGGTGIGGYTLDDKPAADNKRHGTAFGMEWIITTVETVLGTHGRWEFLVGTRCFMLHDPDVGVYSRAGFNCKGLASLDSARVMIFDEVGKHLLEHGGLTE